MMTAPGSRLQLEAEAEAALAQLKAGFLISEPRMCMPGFEASVRSIVAKGAAKAVIRRMRLR